MPSGGAEATPLTAEEIAGSESDEAYARSIAAVIALHKPQATACYERAFKHSERGWPTLAPHTLDIAALWSVMTRLEEPTHANMSVLQKARLYNGEEVQGFGPEHVADLRAQSQREGMSGISPRYVQDRLAQALVRAESCVDAFDVLDEISARERTVPDQWQVQVQAKIQVKARVGVHSAYLSDEDLRAAHLEPVPDLAEAVGRALAEAGPDARVCVLPEGPQTIPYLL